VFGNQNTKNIVKKSIRKQNYNMPGYGQFSGREFLVYTPNMANLSEFLIYTDGGCSGNPGPGGWAYVIINNKEQITNNKEREPVLVVEKWGAERETTNNRMELMAVISALEYLRQIRPPAGKASVFTDSQYVQKGMTVWITDWKNRGWKTSGKKPVKNQDLWQRLDSLAAEIFINWVWVKGHAGDKYNERCDFLTQKAIASLL